MNLLGEDLAALGVVLGYTLLTVALDLDIPLGWKVLLGLAGGVLFFYRHDNTPTGSA